MYGYGGRKWSLSFFLPSKQTFFLSRSLSLSVLLRLSLPLRHTHLHAYIWKCMYEHVYIFALLHPTLLSHAHAQVPRCGERDDRSRIHNRLQGWRQGDACPAPQYPYPPRQNQLRPLLGSENIFQILFANLCSV